MDTNEKDFVWDAFRDINNADDLAAYLEQTTKTHGKYFHYTGIDAIESILGSGMFWLTNVRGFNDTTDSAQFNDGEPYYSLCLSGGTHENIPMWYLYAGVKGNGGRLSMTDTRFGQLIENARYNLCRISVEDGKRVAVEPELLTDATMKMTFRDIIYYDTASVNSQHAKMKYNTMKNYENMPKEEFEKFRKTTGRGFCKALEWFYEKETRILVKLKGAAKEKVKEDLNKNENFDYVVTMSIDPRVLDSLKLTFAPEIDDIFEIYKDKLAIRKHMEKSSNLSLSTYAGKINMNLCAKCAKN